MLLIDENLSYKLADRLATLFPGTVAVSNALGNGVSDRAVWDYAKNNRLALVTKDKDFVEYWLRCGSPPKLIRIQIGNSTVAAMVKLFTENESRIKQFINKNDSDGLLQIS